MRSGWKALLPTEHSCRILRQCAVDSALVQGEFSQAGWWVVRPEGVRHYGSFCGGHTGGRRLGARAVPPPSLGPYEQMKVRGL